MTYRESTPLRVVKTRFALLPEPIRAAMLARRFDWGVKPLAMRLRGRLRPGRPLLCGLIASAVAAVLPMLGGFDNGTALVVFATAAIGAGLLAFGIAQLLRSMTFGLRYQAILLEPNWLACTVGIGERVDLIPLVMVESVTKPAGPDVQVLLRGDGGTLHYPHDDKEDLNRFNAAVRAALPAAQVPPPLPDALDRDIAPFSRVPSVVIAALFAVVAGLPAGYFAFSRRAIEEYYRVKSQHSTRDSLEYFDRWRLDGGFVWWTLRRSTDIVASERSDRAYVDEADRNAARARLEADEQEVTRTTDFHELRRIAETHAGTPLGEQALAWIHTVLEQDLVSAAARGASQDQMTLCRQIRYAGELRPAGGLSLTIETPSEQSESDAFTALGLRTTIDGHATGDVSAMHSAFAEGLRGELNGVLHAALGIWTGTHIPPSPSALVRATFEPTEPVLADPARLRNGRVVEWARYPSVTVTIEVVLRATPAGPPIEFRETYTARAETMPVEHWGGPLYRGLCEPIGRQAAAAILDRLCLGSNAH